MAISFGLTRLSRRRRRRKIKPVSSPPLICGKGEVVKSAKLEAGRGESERARAFLQSLLFFWSSFSSRSPAFVGCGGGRGAWLESSVRFCPSYTAGYVRPLCWVGRIKGCHYRQVSSWQYSSILLLLLNFFPLLRPRFGHVACCAMCHHSHYFLLFFFAVDGIRGSCEISFFSLL